jgi:transcriptional regulator with PAS, ATPase and Fis domain
VARYIHRMSPRSGGPFIPWSCAAVSESLLMSDLFGHLRGSFTGADMDRPGVFETARGGTVFLDEIGDLPPAAQGMFLRVLQEKEVRRLGETLPRRVDVRVVAATHRNLEQMVEEGSFRQDLFYRLKVAAVRLPPLRERGDDLLELAHHFLDEIDRRCGGSQRLSETARHRLRSHSWPGNVRELKNLLEAASALADGGVIEPEHLQLPDVRHGKPSRYHESLLAHRKSVLREALSASRGNQAEAARNLGLSRQTLSYLVRKYQIIVPRE